MKISSIFFSLAFPAALTAAQPISADALVAQVVAQNPELRFYEAELASARASVRLAGAPADPELALQLGRKRVHTPAGALAGEGTTWSVSVAQTFEWPGRLALRKALANRQVELAELGLARFRAALTARASLLAFGLQAARENAAATAEVAGRYRELREVFLQRDPAGLTPLLETRVLEAQEIALQRRADEAALALQSALTELNQLRGAPLDAELELTGAALPASTSDPAPLPAAADLLAAARENNFEFRQKQVELEQQGLAVSLARHERKPAVTVTPFLSEENAGDRERTFGLGLTIPLPVSPRGSAGIAAAEARRRQAEAAALVAAQALERAVLAAAAEFGVKRAALARWQPDAVQSLRDAAALADRHYRLGAVPLATYVELQNSYLDAVESLLATQREALDAGLRLRALTGLDLPLLSAQP